VNLFLAVGTTYGAGTYRITMSVSGGSGYQAGDVLTATIPSWGLVIQITVLQVDENGVITDYLFAPNTYTNIFVAP
jgi:hypothetical protein